VPVLLQLVAGVVVVDMMLVVLQLHQADLVVAEAANMVVLLVLWDKATTEAVVQDNGGLQVAVVQVQ